MTVGGDKIDFDDDSASPAVSLLETKIMINSVISDADKGARFGTGDVKNFYLNNTMENFRYMKIPLNFITAEIMKKYNINDITSNGYVYIEIRKAMYGLKEAGIIAYQLLVKNLAPHGYHPCTHTPGHWKYVTRKIMFNLAVDDFGIKYVHKYYIDHMFTALRQNYEISTDLTGTHYCGLPID